MGNRSIHRKTCPNATFVSASVRVSVKAETVLVQEQSQC